MLMERNAEIIRGWPYDGARDRAETISSGATLQNGNWVQKQSDGTVNLSGGTAANKVTAIRLRLQTPIWLWFSGAILLLRSLTTITRKRTHQVTTLLA
jgi:hypothetical protein